MKLLLLVAVIVCSNISFGQLKVYEFEQVDSLQKQEKRPIVVFIHTDWCRYCKMMESSTFKSDSIIYKLNHHFYFISFNPEKKRTIGFAGHKFTFQPLKGVNELAEHLATIGGKISYPSVCVLSPANEIIFQYNQYLDAINLNKVLGNLRLSRSQ